MVHGSAPCSLRRGPLRDQTTLHWRSCLDLPVRLAASSRADLYREMLRESKHFGAYSYRTYAIGRISDAFGGNKDVKDPVEIQTLANKAKRVLEMIRRQVHMGQLHSTDKLIIENQKPKT